MFQKRSSILTLWEFDLTRWFVKLYYYTFLTNHTFLLFHTTHMWSGFLWDSAVYNYFISHDKFSMNHDSTITTVYLGNLSSPLLISSWHCFFYLATESLPGPWDILHLFTKRILGFFLPGLQASPCSLCLCFPPNSSDENAPMVLAAGACICNLLTATWLSLSSSPSQLAPGLK